MPRPCRRPPPEAGAAARGGRVETDEEVPPGGGTCGALAPDDLADDFGFPRCGLPRGHTGRHREPASGAARHGEDRAAPAAGRTRGRTRG
ncbi:hypothetical protein GCM10010420_10430 [Streptomyces glaucosporus]|uniref:Uncharacterized protein n=1 Tax=Streptomyces glaucosporus TaxID=284044 RepID=A0ABP5UVS6_9ACTN